MLFQLLSRGGIYILFIVGIGGRWLYQRMNKRAEEKKKQAEDHITIDDPITSLSNKDWRIRILALQSLGASPNAENVPSLAAMLRDNVFDVRDAASSALIAHGEDALISTIEILETGELEAREMAIKVLSGIQSPIAIAAMERALLEDESAWVRIPAAEALGKTKDSRVIPSLIRALQDEHKNVYDTVLALLQEFGTREALEAIKQHPYRSKEAKQSEKNDFLHLS